MSHSTRRAILLLALTLVLTAVSVNAQVPVISQIVPQPTPAGTPTANITIIGSNFGLSSDTITFPGNPPVIVFPSSWMSGQLGVDVPQTWSGDISVFSGSPSPNHPFLVSYNWTGNKWFSLPFTWHLNQNGAPGCAINDVATATHRAYDVWECGSGADVTYGGTTTRDGANHDDGWNVEYWSTTPWADPNIIAVATFHYIIATGQIVEADIHYNGADWTWGVPGTSTTVDVQHIATHESGHTLGLADLYGAADMGKTMYGLTGNNEFWALDLTVADVEGAEYMYPHSGRCNFTWSTPSGWWGPVVPRDANDATGTYAPLPSSLPGNYPAFVNFNEANLGSDCGAPHSWVDCFLDDTLVNRSGWTAIFGAGVTRQYVNKPSTVRSGRHTYRIEYDAADELVESVETDNTYYAQFAWSPFGLADQHPEIRPAPPPKGQLTYPNCEGFMFTGNWWGGVAITPLNAADDYDLRLFDDYAGSTVGYQTVKALSQAYGGETDIVLVNGNVAGNGLTRWAGVTRWSAPVGADVVVQQSNQIGSSYIVSPTPGADSRTGPRPLTTNQIFKIHEFQLTDPGITYEIRLDNISGGADLDFMVLDNAMAYQDPSDALITRNAAGAGEDESALFQPPLADYYGIAVFKAGSSDLASDAMYELIVGMALPNLDAQHVPTGFDAPIVARNTTGAGPGNAHVTGVLDGNAPTTYLSYAVEQEGPNDSSQWETRVYLDLEHLVDFAWSGEPVPPTTVEWFNRGPIAVPGGRHTIHLAADLDNIVAESDEEDNAFDMQYVWSPLALTAGVPVVREPPPALGFMPYLNCDGMVFTRLSSFAWVVGLTPSDESDDYDLVLYDDYVDSQHGFENIREYSPLYGMDTDFIVGHYAGTPVNAYVGGLRASLGAGNPCVVDAIDAGGRNAANEGAYPFQLMDPIRVVDVFEAYLEVGESIRFRLEQHGRTGDLQLHVFPGTPGGVHTAGEEHAISTPDEFGVEWVDFLAEEAGWHPLVVARISGHSLGSPIEYSLTWAPVASDVAEPEAGPRTLAFLAPAPNPTPGRSRLGFELPRPDRVRIDVFDVRGRRVKTVVDRDFPAGRHHQEWTGRDQAGHEVAAGVYYARLSVGDQILTRRLTVMH